VEEQAQRLELCSTPM